jgi:uncharacterized protein (DUF4415 family)
MSDTKKTGIGGILDGLLTTASGKLPKAAKIQTVKSPKSNTHHVQEPKEVKKIAARRGRPLGKGSERKEPKEKLTVWLDAQLIADYRDWSWEARCQLSSLVENALIEHRKHKHKQKTISR